MNASYTPGLARQGLASQEFPDGEFCACGSTKPMKKHKHHYTCTECKGRTCRKCMTAVGEHKAKWMLHAAGCK